ncbi:MAG: hypothetical protein EOL97_04650 [Spirochaetia bacterium]|nr:hypothetical protein [Spirochaetia bacterium]
MANFLPANSSPFGQMGLYTPDWSFLTTVMGAKQAEYDKGFNAVKSAYDQINSLDLTNPENVAYKDSIMQKLDGAFKSIANLDLSKGENINKALATMNPITKDKMLMYDYSVTQKMKSEMSKMESYKNSTDPQIRKQYDRHAELYLNYGFQELTEASRKDGSILQVQPRSFVPFGDPVAKLDKAMKDAGIKIKTTDLEGGYIIETINGEMSIPYFESWAKMQMGNEFAEQFNVMGSVQVESAVRSIMQEQGVDKRTATQYVAESLAPMLVEKETQKALAFDREYQSVSHIINSLDPNAQITAKDEAYILQLLEKQNGLKIAKENAVSESFKLLEGSIDYVQGNLAQFFTNGLQDDIVSNWASNTAMMTSEQSIKADDVVLTKMRIASTEKIHAQDLAYKYAALAQDDKWKTIDYTSKVNPTASQGSKVNSNGIVETIVGSYTSQGEIKTKAENMKESYDYANQQLFQSLTASDGLLSLIGFSSDPMENTQLQEKYTGALNELFELASTTGRGSTKTLSPSTVATLTELVNKVGLEGVDPAKVTAIVRPETARNLFDYLTTGIYENARDISLATAGVQGDDPAKVALLNDVLSNMSQLVDIKDEIYKTWSDVSDMIAADESGIYAGAKFIRYDSQGKPLFDPSSMSAASQSTIDSFIPERFNQGVPIGESIAYSGINDNILQFIIVSTEDIALDKKNIEIEGDLDLEELQLMSATELGKAFSNTMRLDYDPNEESAKITFTGTIGTGEKAKNVKITYDADYSTLQSNPAFTQILGDGLSRNSQKPIGSSGPFTSLLTNPNAYVPYKSNVSDLNFTIKGGQNRQGNYGYSLKAYYKNPETGVEEQYSKFILAPIGNETGIVSLNEAIFNIENMYMTNKNLLRQQQLSETPTKSIYEVIQGYNATR